jgi:hydroxymethylpyrimidine/phosphomethylpyrimidine kinase
LTSQADAVDFLLDETGNFVDFREEYIDVGEVHGSGCTLSAAIAANLGKGLSLNEAVGAAKTYLTKQIRALATQ